MLVKDIQLRKDLIDSMRHLQSLGLRSNTKQGRPAPMPSVATLASKLCIILVEAAVVTTLEVIDIGLVGDRRDAEERR